MLLRHKDPMGQAIADYYKNNKAEDIVVYSDIADDDKIPVEYLFREYAQMPKIEQMALEMCKGRVLDVGAAAGVHSDWLTNEGHNVLSIDISELSVEVMTQKGIDAKCVDFFHLEENSKFETILLLMNGTGIAGSLKYLPMLLNKCYNLLDTNGQVLIDSSDLEYMFDSDLEKPSNKYYGEVEYVMSYKQIESDPFSWLFVDYQTLKAVANKTGFDCSKIKDGKNYDYLAKLVK